MDFDSEPDYESIREQNMKELEALMSQYQTPIYTDAMDSINTYKNIHKIGKDIVSKKRKRTNGDEPFRCNVLIPLEPRKSSRLANVAPTFSYLDLPDDKEIFNTNSDGINIEDLEKPIFNPRKQKIKSNLTPFKIIPVESITEGYLNNIAGKTTKKIYSQSGTSCHQCRQKTIDSKTYCRNVNCVGVRGQFCGVCLKNRYGEEAKKVLLDPKWKCPPCRGLCNCSICRAREGKRPTGILAPIAFKNGHKSVKDFLISLNGKGDYINSDENTYNLNDFNENSCLLGCDHFDLIGFNKNKNPIIVINEKNLICERISRCKGDLLGFNSELKAVLMLPSN